MFFEALILILQFWHQCERVYKWSGRFAYCVKTRYNQNWRNIWMYTPAHESPTVKTCPSLRIGFPSQTLNHILPIGSRSAMIADKRRWHSSIRSDNCNNDHEICNKHLCYNNFFTISFRFFCYSIWKIM